MALVRPCHSGCGCSGCANTNCGCNTRASGSSASGNWSGYGALGSVSGPYARQLVSDYPYYTGPCGPTQPCTNCCCPGLPWPPPVLPPDCDSSALPFAGPGAAASFSASVPLNLTAGANVPLALVNGDSLAYAASEGGVRIRCAGVYFVAFTINAPATPAINSSFSLELNGSTLPSSALTVTTSAGTATSSFTGHALVQASAGSLLTLNPASAVDLSSAAASSNAFTLTIVRLS